MWPADRGRARVGALDRRAEMHSGFAALRNEMTMCIRERVDVRPVVAGARRRHRARRRDLERRARALRRAAAISCAARSASPTRSTARSRFASAPTASRRRARRARICAALLAHPCMREWEQAALRETDDHRRRRAAHASIATSIAAAGAATMSDAAIAAWQRAHPRGGRGDDAAAHPSAAAPRISTARRSTGEVLDVSALRRHRRLRSDRARDHRARRHAAGRRRAGDARDAARCSRSSRRISARRRRSAAASPPGLSGPRRPYAGAVRDLVLGVRVLDGTRRRPLVRRPGDEERRGLRRRRG